MTAATANHTRLWPAPVPPPRFKRLVLFDDHDTPPDSDREMRRLVQQAVDWGVTDVVDGVSNVVGTMPYILGTGSPEDRMKRLRDYAHAHVDAGLRYHTSLWHKPGAWHRELLRLTTELSGVLEGLQTSSIWDMEGHSYGPRSTMDHRAGAQDVGRMTWDMACPWGLTIIPHHTEKARPYMDAATWLLFQVLSFEDEAKGMGLTNPSTLPGFWIEDTLDDFEGRRSWVKDLVEVVFLNAAYKLDRWRGVDAEDAFEIPMRVMLAHGLLSAGVFSRWWMERHPALGDELVALGPLRQISEAERIDEMLGGATPEEAEAEVERGVLIELLEEAGGRGALELVGEDADEVYDDIKAEVLAHEGFVWSEEPNWINVVCRETGGTVDRYDDDLLLTWVDGDGVRHVTITPLNMQPSSKALRRPLRVALRRGGTAKVYTPQQVANYNLAKFRKRWSLCQYRNTGTIKVWRDGDRDGELDPVEVLVRDEGHHGIFGHQGGIDREEGMDLVGSYGCWTWPPPVQRLIVRTLRIHARAHGWRSFRVTFIGRDALEAHA